MRNAAIALLFCAGVAAAQVILPADKTEFDTVLTLRPAPPKKAEITSVEWTGTPQATLGDPTIAGDRMQIHLSDLYFAGQARLSVEFDNGDRYAWNLRRGPALASPAAHVERGGQGQIWLHNFEAQPLKVRWRVVSGAESVCGIDAGGAPRRDCGSVTRWAEATLGPVRSDPISFALPDWWFNPWRLSGADKREALLELRFGADDNAPLQRERLELNLTAGLPDIVVKIGNLLMLTFWITLGSVCLMLAQVMIPNFRKYLTMEAQIDSLQERLRAIGSRVGDRLYTRCLQELSSVSYGLGLSQKGSKSLVRMALAGNTAEINRLATILSRIDTRVRLTERLDEIQVAPDLGPGETPPCFHRNRAKELSNVQAILSRQFVTDGDEKSASASLDLLEDSDAALKEFATDVEVRIAGIRRQFCLEPWTSKYPALIANLNGCTQLLAEEKSNPPEGGWTTAELSDRDLAAFRLELVHQMITLEPLLNDHAEIKTQVLDKLKSSDPAVLESAQVQLLQLSQLIFEDDVKKALESCMWDVYFEPTTVSDQDVLRGTFIFRDRRLDRCTAKSRFQCFWKLTQGSDQTAVEAWETGWEFQLIPKVGPLTIRPEIYDSAGTPVSIRPAAGELKDKGTETFAIARPETKLLKRSFRGLLDAAITALVPVITVAVTQLQNGGSTGIGTLLLLGFSSQAIRAAVVPDPVAAVRNSSAANSAGDGSGAAG